MTRFRFSFCAVPFLMLAIALSAGCGGSGTTVSGTVTFNGNPVEDGHINFYPADGKGSPAGGEIKGGKYTVKNVTPGKNRVEVSSYVRGSADSMDASVAAAKNAKTSPDAITPTDDGNGKTHDIGSGSTELNLTIKASVSSDGKR